MVQTFLVEEAKELIYDSDKIQEWKNKCNELGLDGQLELASSDKSPVPFEFMNTVTLRVYETLCPQKENYKRYNKTAIPLEVLSLIALSVQENYFTDIQIWFDDKTPDPLAVGLIRNKDGYSNTYYTIARWGDVLRPFDELKEKAISVYRRSAEIKLKSKMADVKSKIDQLESNVMGYFDCTVDDYTVVGF